MQITNEAEPHTNTYFAVGFGEFKIASGSLMPSDTFTTNEVELKLTQLHRISLFKEPGDFDA